MAVKIRLARGGSKKKPFYKIVVADERFSRDGRICEKIGYFHPVANPPLIELQLDRLDHWVAKGAKPTTTTNKLIREFRKKLAGK
jgi:small subunit ribosomal protein S16